MFQILDYLALKFIVKYHLVVLDPLIIYQGAQRSLKFQLCVVSSGGAEELASPPRI